MKKLVSILLAILVLLIGGIYLYNSSNQTPRSNNTHKNIFSQKENPTYHAKIWATGDIMYHKPLYGRNFDDSTGKYTFNTYYQKVSEYLNGTDLVIGNFESTVNPNKPISGHPMFNTPPEAIEYLKSVGFDALATSNNHCLDTGFDGVQTTLDAMDSYGMKHFGTREENAKPLIITVNGIAIGLLSYSEMFNGLDGLVPEKNKYQISPLDENLILGDIKNLKELGADYIIAYPHWGVEYAENPSETQKYFENFMLKNGVDAVLGSHPHVLQKAELKNIDGKNKFTIFSMGNSVSNQRHQWLHKKGVESGVFVELNLVKKDNKTELESFILHPTYANRYFDENGKAQTEVILYSDLLQGGKYRDLLDNSTKSFIDNEYEWVKNRLSILRS